MLFLCCFLSGFFPTEHNIENKNKQINTRTHTQSNYWTSSKQLQQHPENNAKHMLTHQKITQKTNTLPTLPPPIPPHTNNEVEITVQI